MNGARRVREEAIKLHADKFAPSDFEQAQKTWEHAQAAEKEGNTGAAKVIYTTAKINFGKAADIAKSKQEALSRELSSMQLMISDNLSQVKADLTKGNASAQQRSRVKAIVSAVEKSKSSIDKLVQEEDLVKAVAAAKEVQTEIYHAQLILTGKNPK